MQRGFDIAIVFIRVIIAWRILSGVYPYVFALKEIDEVINYFSHLNLPQPKVSAYLSVYAQLVCGISFAAGIFTRYAGMVMAFNFTVAILSAHLKDSIETSFPAFILLANSLLLVQAGGGRYSLDALLFPNKKKPVSPLMHLYE
jgi:putative oxidoreductase